MQPLLSVSSTPLQPVTQSGRIKTIDVLRGVAVLGILLMNIPSFSMPERFRDAFKSDPHSLNFWVDTVITVLFEGKMRALFSMLFGAGILLFFQQKEQDGRTPTWLFLRRMGWLTLFGLMQAHVLLWAGDILYFYGTIGLLAFLFRKMKPAYLALGVPIVAVIGFGIGTMYYQDIRAKRLAYNEVQAVQKQHKPLTSSQKQALTDWRGIEAFFLPNPSEVAEHTRMMKSGYATVAERVRPLAWRLETKQFAGELGDALALFLLGMALLKWGFFTGGWSRKQYIQTALIGYGIGLPLVMYNTYDIFRNYATVAAQIQYLETHVIPWSDLIYPAQRIFLVLAHTATLLLILQAGWFPKLMTRLAAVGQMAFTNYLSQTIICTLFFYGYGLNYFAELQYYQLYYVVAGIWLFQLIISPIWLQYFRFGPFEWLWRSLTYWQLQPMRR